MNQPHPLIKTLKKLLKIRGMTYRMVAKSLGLSEASVKRLFATGSFSLARLDQICLMMGLEIADLVRIADTESHRLVELTEAQELELASDHKLLLVAFLVVNGWSFEDIHNRYNLSQSELIACFAKLEKLKLIEFLPNNRFKLLISTNFSWRKNGPILNFFAEHLKQDYFSERFQKRTEALMFAPGMLSDESSEVLIKKMEQLISDFNSVNSQNSNLPAEQRSPYSLVIALRPWKPSIFSKLRK